MIEPDPDIKKMDINAIKKSGKFTPQERADEYIRRSKSPSGVIDSVFIDTQRGNAAYNDMDRDWEADA
jgi:hypothetical protein